MQREARQVVPAKRILPCFPDQRSAQTAGTLDGFPSFRAAPRWERSAERPSCETPVRTPGGYPAILVTRQEISCLLERPEAPDISIEVFAR